MAYTRTPAEQRAAEVVAAVMLAHEAAVAAGAEDVAMLLGAAFDASRGTAGEFIVNYSRQVGGDVY
jgi:hypothetical protein